MRLASFNELGDLVTGKLPRFLTRRNVSANDGGYLPVFTFHSLDPADFEAKLGHLQRNRYHTLTLDEAVAHLRGEGAIPDRAVVLTIDDGRLSTWTVGQPLLRKYGMVATAFIIPGYTAEGACRPTLDDPGFSGPTDEVADRQTYCNWSEIEAMHRGGHVQIESHTTLHRRVFTSLQVDAFLSPTFRNNVYLIPMSLDSINPWPMDAATTMFGAALGPSRPILSVESAYNPPDAAIDACVTFVQHEGGAEFFKASNWQARLQACYLDAMARTAPPSQRDTAATQTWEFAQARRMIEDRLPGKTVRHFCYPEAGGSSRSVQLSKDAGYCSNFWGAHDARTANRPGTDPWRIGRLKHDYIPCLPGDGRISLPRILYLKTTRRLAGRTGF